MQQSQVSAQVSTAKDYPMNATWLFHAPPGEVTGDRKQQWIRANSQKFGHKSVPVLPVKVNSHSADSSISLKPQVWVAFNWINGAIYYFTIGYEWDFLRFTIYGPSMSESEMTISVCN